MKTDKASLQTIEDVAGTKLNDLDGDRIFVDEGELGRGGMGAVRRVFDPRLMRRTAMKRLDQRRASEDLVRRFVDEARVTGQLEHANIVPVHEFGFDDSGALYMSLKLIRGWTLWEVVHQMGEDRLDADKLGDLVQVLIKVCQAVAYAHSRGVIHRDLKPSNIMVGEFGQVTVLDWGVAKVHGVAEDAVCLGRPIDDTPDRFDQLVGTPAWMSPEQAIADHDAVDQRTDVYAIGAMLYFVLTAHSPYKGSLPQQIWMAQAGEVVPPEERSCGRPLPTGLLRIAMKAMAKDPAGRFDSASEVGNALESFLRGTWNLPQRRWAKGDCVIREGDVGDTAYVVVTGSLKVHVQASGERTVLRELGPGDVFGEMAVFTNRPRSATVEATTEVQLIEVTRAALTDGLGLNSWMGTFVTALAERFYEADRALREDD